MEGKDGASSSSGGDGLLPWMTLNDNKAGMEGIDRDKINKIILEASKGSKFYENELKKEQQVNQRIERMMQQKALITEQQLKKAQVQVEKLTADLERGRELSRVIVHVDMDAFYAAVEMRDRPELKDTPMAVGSWSMLSTSNYHARKFGVRAAMPGFIAKKLCPNLIIVPLNFEKYRTVSLEVREIFAEYDPNFLPMSLDEAYLDITDHLMHRQSWPESMRTHYQHSGSPEGVVVFGTCAEEAVREMRFRIEQRTMLTASAGIAPNMMLAKVCSDKNKPNGQYRVPAEQQAVMDFIQNLPIRKVPGVGKVTEKMLSALGIKTCSELYRKGAFLSLLFSETSFHHFLQISLGLGSTHITRDGERKSMSTERTFAEMSNAEEQLHLCKDLCGDLAKDLQKEGLKGKTVTVKLKNVNFEVKTRALTLSSVVSTEEEIFAAAKDLLKAEMDSISPEPLRLRLMGVRVSGFVSRDKKKPHQKSIIGFLQSGLLKSGEAFQQPASEELPCLPPADFQKDSGVLSPVVCPPKQEMPKQKTGQREQQSFFQMAYTRRLQLQAKQQESPGSNDQTSTLEHPQLDAPQEEYFTCPVCFHKLKDIDLGKFNVHVDECLSSTSTEPWEQDLVKNSGVAGGGSARKEEEFHRGQLKAPNLGKGGVHTATARSSVCIQMSHHGQPLTPIAHAMPGLVSQTSQDYDKNSRNDSDFQKVNSDCHSPRRATSSDIMFKGLYSAEAENPEPGILALTCPICNVQQNASDLAIFNRHVDICLNQGILKEMGQDVVSHTTEIPSCAGVQPKPLCGGQTLGKSDAWRAPNSRCKRQKSSPLHTPHKKAKATGSIHILERFFR